MTRMIEEANFSPSDAQQLVDVLLSTSSQSSEWVSRGAHGRSQETVATVKQQRDALAAELDDVRNSQRAALELMKEKKAEHVEEAKQLKLQVDACRRMIAQKTKEASQFQEKLRALEEELDAKPVPVVTEDVQRFMSENARLRSDLESAQSRLADSMAACDNVKQAAKSTEASLNNQLQQARSNADKQQKRARDLEKQVQSGAENEVHNRFCFIVHLWIGQAEIPCRICRSSLIYAELPCRFGTSQTLRIRTGSEVEALTFLAHFLRACIN